MLSNSFLEDFPGGSDGKASVCNAGDLSSIPGSGRSPGEGNGNPLQYSCLENPMDRGEGGERWATDHGVTKSWTGLSNFTLRMRWASWIAQLVKNLPAMGETLVQSLGWDDPLEKG